MGAKGMSLFYTHKWGILTPKKVPSSRNTLNKAMIFLIRVKVRLYVSKIQTCILCP